MKIKTKIISTALAIALASSFTGCGGGGSSSEPSSSTQQDADNTQDQTTQQETPSDDQETIQSVSVLSGAVDISETQTLITKSTRGYINILNENLECGASADIQLYDITDIDYENPLLKEPLKVNTTTCMYDITSNKFKDPANAGSDKKYIIRTIIKQANGEKLELAATKLQPGKEAPKVDPVATLVKAKFAQIIKDTQESMQTLVDQFGIDESIVQTALEEIKKTLEDIFETTVNAIKNDIAEGKIVLKSEDFETEENFDQPQTEEIKKKREAKQKAQKEMAENSSASANLSIVDNKIKQDNIKQVTSTFSNQDELIKELKGKLSKPIAQMKYDIIESFVKMGLSVHDGDGKLIVFLPVDPKEKGKLPGKMFTIKYYDKNSDQKEASGVIGDDFAIRVIDPEKDLAKVNGTEIWFQNLNIYSPKIPNRVIDQFIIKKDYTITMEELGKMLDMMTPRQDGSMGDGTQDKLQNLYGKKLSSDIQKSSATILDVYKVGLLKNSYDRAFFDRLHVVFANPTNVVDRILELPFIAKENETKEDFINRIIQNSKVMGYLKNQLGRSLANGIPVSADNGILQFKEGFEIAKDTKIKPLTAVTLVNLHMEANGGGIDNLIFKKIPLNEEFGWIENKGNKFDNQYIWMLKWNELQTNSEDDFDNKSLDDIAEETKEMVIALVKLITGTQEIKIERSFDDMVKKLNSSMQKIEKKMRANANRNVFEDTFKADIVDFDINKPASVKFLVEDLNGNKLNDLNLTLVPIFENIETFERISISNLAITVNPSNDGNFSYEVSSIQLREPNKLFDQNGTETPNGKFRSVPDFELIVDDNGTKKPIAIFPIFPGENNLIYPFIYDSTIDYGFTDMSYQQPGMGASMPQNFAEHYWIDFSSNDINMIFFPQIITKEGNIVGENILKLSNQTLSELPDNDKVGKMIDSDLDIVIIAKDYNGTGLPSSVDNLILGDNIKEGGLATLSLSGEYLKDQVINLEVTYLDENGAEIRLSKEFTQNSMNQEANFDFIKDRFKREKRFTFISNEKSENGDIDDLEFEGNSVIFKDKVYEFVFEDFDSITMVDQSNNNFVTFKFIKEEFKKVISISDNDINNKELLFVDDFMAIRAIFNSDHSLQIIEKERFGRFDNTRSGTWSVEHGAIKLEFPNMQGYINLVITKDSDSNGIIGLNDKIIFANILDENKIEPISPEHEIRYLGDIRDSSNIDPFEGLINENSNSNPMPPQSDPNNNDNNNTMPPQNPNDNGDDNMTPPQSDPNAPDIQEPIITGEENLKTLFADQSFYIGIQDQNGSTHLKTLHFNAMLTSVATPEGDRDITIESNGLKTTDDPNKGYMLIEVIEQTQSFIKVQLTLSNPDGSHQVLDSVEKWYYNSSDAEANYDSIIYKRPESENMQ